MYEISIPMPYEKELTDKILEINKQIEKSKITNVYFALPKTDIDKTGFEQTRTAYKIKTKSDYWFERIIYAMEKGLDFIYLLNSPKPLLYESPHLKKQLDKLDSLINNFRKYGIKKIRISNIQLLDYIAKNYPDMELYGSTSYEYTSIKQYRNLLKAFPQIKQIVPSHEVNKNFKLLKNIKEQYPNLQIEIMLNEGCLGGCPFRFWHAMSFPSIISPNIDNMNENLTSQYFIKKCTSISDKDNIFNTIFLSNNIYPWQLEEYYKIGINKFKLVGRDDSQGYEDGSFLNSYLKYLKGIDNYKNIENELFRNFIHYHSRTHLEYKVKEIKPFLPDIKHFVKNGHLCSSTCGSECNYCYKCAEKLKNTLIKN